MGDIINNFTGFIKMSFGIKIYGVMSVIYSLRVLSIVTNPNIYDAPYMIRAGYIVTSICWMVFGIGIIKRYPWARIGLIALAVSYLIDYVTYPPERIISAIKNHDLSPAWVISVIFFISLIIYFMRPKIKQQFEVANATPKEVTKNQRALLREKTKKAVAAQRQDTTDSEKAHPLLFAWTILRLVYTYIQYLISGMGEGSFYIKKANCYLGLQWLIVRSSVTKEH